MIESDNGEERLARVEEMIEALKRESAVPKKAAAKAAGRVQIPAMIALPPHKPAGRKKQKR